MASTNEQQILGVYHTHSKFSKFNHGKDTAQDMIKTASSLGLKEYAITDHGYKHVFGIRRKNIKKLREIINKSNTEGKMKTLMGIELNLLGMNGETDFLPELEDVLDIRLLGFHKMGRVSFKNLFKFLLPNVFRRKNPQIIERNTDAYISAVKKYKIDIITHPQEYVRVNLVRLAKACEENNCYLEINNKHLNMTKEELEELVQKTNVKFIISSDAHKKENIARIDRALALALESGIPEDRIANLNKLPNFKEKY